MHNYFASYQELSHYLRRKFSGYWIFWEIHQLPILEIPLQAQIYTQNENIKLDLYCKNGFLKRSKQQKNPIEYHLNIPIQEWTVKEDYGSVEYLDNGILHFLQIQAMNQKECYLSWERISHGFKEVLFSTKLHQGFFFSFTQQKSLNL